MEAPETTTTRRGTWLSLLIGAVVSGLAVVLIARSVDLSLTLQTLAASSLLWFAGAFLVQLIATLFNMRRWQVLLQPYTTRFSNLLQIFLIAHLLNTVLPAKLGAVGRVLLAAESEKLNVGFVLGSVAVEKVLDTVFMLVLLVLLAPFAPLSAWLRDSLTVSVLLVLGALGALASVQQIREPLVDFLARAETRLLNRPSQRLAVLTSGILESFVNLTKRREAFKVLFWTVLIWLCGGIVNQMLFAALGIQVAWSAGWFLMVVLQIGTRVPALPANLGVFHYLVILALGVYGVNESTAFAYAILLHLIVFILPALIGAVCALPVSTRLVALVANGWGGRRIFAEGAQQE